MLIPLKALPLELREPEDVLEARGVDERLPAEADVAGFPVDAGADRFAAVEPERFCAAAARFPVPDDVVPARAWPVPACPDEDPQPRASRLCAVEAVETEFFRRP